MADIVVRQDGQLPIETQIRYRDMGDGTYALVQYTPAVATTISGTVQVAQSDRNSLNANVSLQMTGADVNALNPVPVVTEQIRLLVTPVIGLVIYIAGDALGGILEFPYAALAVGGSGMITKVVIIDDDGEEAPLDLVLFNLGFTATADHDPFTPLDAELPYCLGYIDVAATDYAAFADNSVAVKTSGLRMPFPYRLDPTNDALSLYGQLVVRDTPTYTAIDDITVIITLERYS